MKYTMSLNKNFCLTQSLVDLISIFSCFTSFVAKGCGSSNLIKTNFFNFKDGLLLKASKLVSFVERDSILSKKKMNTENTV